MRVLVVDDSSAIRSRLVARLRDAGLEVVGEAGTASAALELASSLAPDAIVLDLHLPDRSGIEILPVLKLRSARVVIVILTNEPNAHYRRECLARGADFFFDKSSQFDAVAAALVAGHASDDG